MTRSMETNKIKDCRHYLEQKGELGFCLKDLDSKRCWDCTAPNQEERAKQNGYNCPYSKLGKD